ncbi:MAG: hypothetical protein JO188_07840 [Hyphomicrobiales bacterium]|nr:hypothetical protein [Hyphomicrobiales bacterium]
MGEWMGTGVAGCEASDQRIDDGFSCVFDGDPLSERVELLGAAEIEVEIASDTRVAQLCARLCDVAPDGSSRRISYGVLNLTHRESHAEPSPLEPGSFYLVRLKLNDCGYAFAKGHRMRLALSSAYWPLIWPAPKTATLTLRSPAKLVLPVRPSTTVDEEVIFAPPSRGREAPRSRMSEGRMSRTATLDLVGGLSTYSTKSEGGLFGEGVFRLDEIDTTLSHDLERELMIQADDPLSARYRLTQTYELGRENWCIRIETHSSMHSTATQFFVSARLLAFENGALAATRDFEQTIPRDLV